MPTARIWIDADACPRDVKGPKAFGPKDKQRFANALDRALQRLMRARG